MAVPHPADSTDPPAIQVVAGGVFDATGRVLIAQRPAGKALAGRWEFPGGKLLEGEDPWLGLQRELSEELGITIERGERLMRYRVDYPQRVVWLDMCLVSRWQGEPRSLEAQALLWVEPAALGEHDILEADRPIVEALRNGARPPHETLPS
jgi:8-oxo-dGTP diphosphatase